MLTDRLGLPASVQGPVRPPHRALGRQGRARPRQGRRDPAAGADRSRRSRRRVPAHAGRRGVRRARRPRASGRTRSIRRSRRCSRTRPPRSSRSMPTRRRGTRRSPASRARGLTLEGEAIDRALAAMGDFADLVSPYLVGHSAGVAELATAAAAAVPSRCRRPGDDPARGARPRPGARRGPGPHLAEAGAADAGRMGAGQAARVPLRARPVPLAVPRRARAGRQQPTTSDSTARATTAEPTAAALTPARAPARRRRRLPRDDRAETAPRAALGRTGRRDAQPRKPAPDDWTPMRSPRCSRRPASAPRASSGRRG